MAKKATKAEKPTREEYISNVKPHEAHKFIAGWVKKHVPSPKVIFDCGALNGNQSIEFATAFPQAMVYCFEAHPEHAAICRKKTAAWKNIKVVEAALSSEGGKTLTFWGTIESNPGGSSLYKFTDYARKKRGFKQRPLDVKTLALDDFADQEGIAAVDVMWVDLQGHEGPMLHGARRLLSTVSLIHIEAHLTPIYQGQTMFDEIAWRLRQAGLTMRHWIQHHSVVDCGDAIFLRN